MEQICFWESDLNQWDPNYKKEKKEVFELNVSASEDIDTSTDDVI